MAQSTEGKTTTDHGAIRSWAEERGGRPAHVPPTADDGDPGMLRILFPGYGDDSLLAELSWEEWFEKFEESNLALLYQEQTAEGETSTFNKLVSRDAA